MKIFKKNGPKITLTEILSLEKRLNIVFANTYKEFLLKFNGGAPIKNYIELRKFDYDKENTNTYIRIETFYSLEELEEAYGYTRDALAEEGLFAIADVAGGMFLCMESNEYSNGDIYYFDFDFGRIRIGSLQTLFANLISNEEVDYSKYSTEEVITPDEEIIIKNNDFEKLKDLIKAGYNFDSIIKGYDVRLIELATIFIRVEMVKFIHQNGSEFYDSMSIAEENLKFYKGEGLEEIIDYIKNN